MHDVIVVGGGYAGMAAALQLLRARRTVLVIDAGQRRNRFASHSYGFLGQDGVDPAEIAAIARRQLEAYPTLTWAAAAVVAASGSKDDFGVTMENGDVHTARRLLFATGVSDQLPAVPGLAERWGRTVFHCPYCHGYELDRGRIGVIAAGPTSVHQAQLLPEWGEVTFLTNDSVSLEPETRRDLVQRGVAIEETFVERIEGEADVLLADGRRLSFAGLFITTRCVPATKVAEQMGCALVETPMNVLIHTNEANETTIPGVYACGDVARTPYGVSPAVADGTWAGVRLHRSLVWPE
jgi:thioredoxin reductase